jgi:hypothetical protein
MQDPFVGHGQVKTHPFFFATPAGVHDPRRDPRILLWDRVFAIGNLLMSLAIRNFAEQGKSSFYRRSGPVIARMALARFVLCGERRAGWPQQVDTRPENRCREG